MVMRPSSQKGTSRRFFRGFLPNPLGGRFSSRRLSALLPLMMLFLNLSSKEELSNTEGGMNLVGACLATHDRISATGSDTVSRCVLRSCACFCLLSGHTIMGCGSQELCNRSNCSHLFVVRQGCSDRSPGETTNASLKG